ncbi:MAG: exosortase/archaeosortase family protein [Deltaproteobacteria bacterium]
MVVEHITFLLLVAVGAAIFHNALVQLLRMSFNNHLYSYTPLVPLVSAFIVYYRRKRIFTEARWNWLGGLPLIAAGGLFFYLGKHFLGLQGNNFLAMAMSGAVVWLIGSFVLAYGSLAFKKALFPLLFLVFVIPIPTPILDSVVKVLQTGSANATEVVLKVLGVPFHREGFSFSIPGITVVVAEQCSGIRSSLCLVITSVLAGYLFLRKSYSKVILVFSVFPITVFKNALRIVTLSLLAAYVNPDFIGRSWLHTSGGIPFFIVGLILLAPVLWGLRKAEKRGGRAEYQ